MNVNTLKLKSQNLPKYLRDIPAAPKSINWMGTDPAELLSRPRVAVVGSRRFSSYGRLVTENFTSELARADVLIISGLALGIDSIAHSATIKAGGLTLAILPTSLDNIYPPSHRGLAEQILRAGGAIASEYEPGTEAFPSNFIARNRLISGLADGLLITEAAAASGTMHTARFALDQGRTVMAVPGSILSPTSEGCNNLIKAGALPVTNVEDIFFALKIKPSVAKKKLIFKGTNEEKRLLDLINNGVTDQEELAIHCDLAASQLSGLLTMLEIKGYIKPLGAGHWATN